MIDPTVTNNTGVESAEKNLEQAKHRLATEKKKANDARRRIENRHKLANGCQSSERFISLMSMVTRSVRARTINARRSMLPIGMTRAKLRSGERI